MKRRLFTILSALSLLLFVTVAVMWLRSHQVSDRVQFWRAGERWDVFAHHGRFVAQGQRWKLDNTAAEKPWHVEAWEAVEPARAIRDYTRWGGRFTTLDRRWSWAGVEVERQRLGLPTWTWVRVEMRTLAAVSAIPPAAWLAWWLLGRWRRRRRLGAGACPACGYDLRASSERCPECGAPINKPVAPPTRS